MKIYRTILIALLFLLSFSPYSHTQIVYFNSFEKPQDTVGWKGYGSIFFHNDVPPGGGNQSVYVSGGCYWPHALIELGPFNRDGFYKIRCWGKNLEIGGGVSLNVEGNKTLGGINIGVNEKNWTFYESAETLFCPAGKKLELSMGAGGIAPSAMLIDNIQVINVKRLESGWIIRNSGTVENLNDVAMLDSATAVVVGSEGSILKTIDAGETWKSVTPPINCPRPINCLMKFNRVIFYDSLNGITAGKGALLITSDGGEEWQFLNAPSGNDFLSIAKIGLFNIYVGDDSGYIYNSIDTGKTWTHEKVADLPILSIYPPKYNPIILGVYIFELYALTSNSLYIKSGIEPWKEWDQLGFFLGLGSGAFEGEFSENGTQFIVGVQGDFVPQSAIIRLRPGDSHWYSVGPPGEIGELRSLTVPGMPGIYTSGANPIPLPALIYACGSGGKILKSVSNGDYWISLNTPVLQNLNSIYFSNRFEGFAVGDSGTILYTSTGGAVSGNNPPGEFNLIDPPNEDTIPIPRSITFTWQKSIDPDGDPVEYTVLISEDSSISWKQYGPVQDTSLQIQSPTQLPGRYLWRVIADDGSSPRHSSSIFAFTIYSVSDAEKDINRVPHEFTLHQNYPNPFNPSTKIRYELPRESQVQITIYNMIGEKVSELVNEFKKAGSYEIDWKAGNLASGIYFYTISAGNFRQTRKMILMK